MRAASRRWVSWVSLLFGAAVWVLNAYKLATGLGTMGLLDGLGAGMCFLIGPVLLWQWWMDARGRRS